LIEKLIGNPEMRYELIKGIHYCIDPMGKKRSIL